MIYSNLSVHKATYNNAILAYYAFTAIELIRELSRAEVYTLRG
jgi:hypothetical protein